MNKRNKYNYEFRLRCVEAVLKEQGIEHSNLRLWLGFYERYGKSGLMPRAQATRSTTPMAPLPTKL